MGHVFHIQRFSLHDGPGIRTTVFFMGCSLRCRWCHNPEGLRWEIALQYDSKKCVSCGLCAALCPNGVHRFSEGGVHLVDFTRCSLCGQCIRACPSGALLYSGRDYSPEELAALCSRDLPYYRNGGGVTFSGGEALLQASFLRETAQLCKQRGVPTIIVDTAGNVPWSAFEQVLPWVDAFLYDVKAYHEDLHRSATGASNLEILENLKRLDQTGKDLYIRIPVIPTVNDRTEEIRAIAGFLQPLTHVRQIRLIPYHTLGRSKYAALGLPEPPNFGAVDESTLALLEAIVNPG